MITTKSNYASFCCLCVCCGLLNGLIYGVTPLSTNCLQQTFHKHPDKSEAKPLFHTSTVTYSDFNLLMVSINPRNHLTDAINMKVPTSNSCCKLSESVHLSELDSERVISVSQVCITIVCLDRVVP